MSPIQLTLLILLVMVALMALRTPIAVAMFAAGAVGYVIQAGWLPLANFLNTQAYLSSNPGAGSGGVSITFYERK